MTDSQTTVSAFDLLTEARWEMEGTRRASQRYKEAASAADPATLKSGQKLLREVVPGLIGKVTEMQAVASASIATGRSVIPWAWPIQMLDAGAMAMITVVCGLNAARDPGGPLSAVTTVSLEIAAATRDEVNYRAWIEAQTKVNTEAREAKAVATAAGELIDWKHRDLLAAFKRQSPQADRKTWTRWRRKIEALQKETWDKETSLQLGAALLHAMVESAPTRFELTQSTKDTRVLQLSEETMAMMRDIEERASVARPRLMPMLIPPLPWIYT